MRKTTKIIWFGHRNQAGARFARFKLSQIKTTFVIPKQTNEEAIFMFLKSAKPAQSARNNYSQSLR